MRAPLLIEIGCEEIPARMLASAGGQLLDCLVQSLDQAGLAHGSATSWYGPRRLVVRVEEVAARQDDRDEQVCGPPAKVAFDADGSLTRAGLGFAKKQGVEPDALTTVETERGCYVALQRHVPGKTLEQVLGESLPAAVETMSFPKTMRWGDGSRRWVRPVHWVVALHGAEALGFDLLGVRSAARSRGHRFLAAGEVSLTHPDDYLAQLAAASVIVEPGERSRRLDEALREAAKSMDGQPVPDEELLREASNLIEWPGVVLGRFEPGFLELPRELLVTTLRYHQKCFSLQDSQGELLPAFLAIANTDRDPAGHVRRGNEWVVRGRLEDARFFWNEDRRAPLSALSEGLARVIVHARIGSYQGKSERMAAVARRLADALGLGERADLCAKAAALAKNDLLTGTVGEFPELQGRIGGLLLAAEDAATELARAVYEHYQPTGPADPIPPSAEGRITSLADKLETLASFVGIGELPTGSRDPFGLRRASNGVFRILLEGGLRLSLRELSLAAAPAAAESLLEFLRERLSAFFRDAGYNSNEIAAVFRARIDPTAALNWPLDDVRARLEAIRQIRGREDFRQLVKLTERVDTILARNAELIAELEHEGHEGHEGHEAGSAQPASAQPPEQELDRLLSDREPRLASLAQGRAYEDVVSVLAEFIGPVETFFDKVLVLDEKDRPGTLRRCRLLARLRANATRYFDIRELAGQANRR